MSQTTAHPGTAVHASAPAAAAPHAEAQPEPAKVGMHHLVELLGKGGAKDEDIEAMLTQQTRWDNEDVLLLFLTLRGKKPGAAKPGAVGAQAEGARAH